MKYIDVTFREASIIKGFTIDKKTIFEYLSLIKNSDIDYIELGYINYVDLDSFLLKYDKDLIYTSYDIIKTSTIKTSYMLHPKFFRKGLFDKETLEKIWMVRIASSYSDIDNIEDIVNFFTSNWVKVATNLIRVSEITMEQYISFVKKIASLDIEVFYIADTNWSFLFNELLEYMKITQKILNKSIGFHAHDNLWLAISNVITAINNWVEYIDGSFLWFGKWAWNLKTEIFLPLFTKLTWLEFNLKPIMKTYRFFLEKVFLERNLEDYIFKLCKFWFYWLMNDSIDFDNKLSREMNGDKWKELDFVIDKLINFKFYK